MQQIIDAAKDKARIQAQGQVQAANAAAQGQIGASKMASEGNVLANIWSQPANFGSIMGDIYGNYAGNTGAGSELRQRLRRTECRPCGARQQFVRKLRRVHGRAQQRRKQLRHHG